MARPPAPVEISVRVNSLAQLFHSLDPSPYKDRQLTELAEDFIVDWARSEPPDAPLRLTINVPGNETNSEQARQAPMAARRFFLYRCRQARQELRDLFSEGRRALLVGLPLLAGCILLSRLISIYLPEPVLARLLGESLLILGWVANWRPLAIFLYDWWPIQRRLRLYRRLSEADVRVRAI